MSRGKGQHLLKIDLLVAKWVGFVVHIHLGVSFKVAASLDLIIIEN